MAPLISSALRPVVRIIVGLIAIPLFRLFIRRVMKWDKFDAELTKDIEQWVRGSLLLLLATANVEHALVTSLELAIGAKSVAGTPAGLQFVGQPAPQADESQTLPAGAKAAVPAEKDNTPEPAASGEKLKENKKASPRPEPGQWWWISLGLRLLLAVGVIEAMPDQALFAIIYPGPSKLLLPPGRRFQAAREQIWPYCRGMIYRYLDRSSSVLAILSVIIGGSQFQQAGWICYFAAIVQFLLIGLLASRAKAMDVLGEFDRAVQQRREELLQEFRQFD